MNTLIRFPSNRLEGRAQAVIIKDKPIFPPKDCIVPSGTKMTEYRKGGFVLFLVDSSLIHITKKKSVMVTTDNIEKYLQELEDYKHFKILELSDKFIYKIHNEHDHKN